MFAPEVLSPTVERLAELAADGRVLEFAIGTGRVAVPLAERGVPVSEIELSTALLEQLRTKADGAATRATVGDVSAVRVPGEFSPSSNSLATSFSAPDQVAAAFDALVGGGVEARVMGTAVATTSPLEMPTCQRGLAGGSGSLRVSMSCWATSRSLTLLSWE